MIHAAPGSQSQGASKRCERATVATAARFALRLIEQRKKKRRQAAMGCNLPPFRDASVYSSDAGSRNVSRAAKRSSPAYQILPSRVRLKAVSHSLRWSMQNGVADDERGALSRTGQERRRSETPNPQLSRLVSLTRD